MNQPNNPFPDLEAMTAEELDSLNAAIERNQKAFGNKITIGFHRPRYTKKIELFNHILATIIVAGVLSLVLSIGYVVFR